MGRKRIKTEVQRLLDELGIGDSPPIDVNEVAADLGIEVVERSGFELGEDAVSGLLLRTEGRTICVLNGDHHRNRKRFSLAHEIGHFVLHPPQETYVNRVYARDKRSSEGTDPLEVEANAFAAEFLMPEDLVKGELPFPLNVGDEEEIRLLARTFQVSPQAMTLRLYTLKLLW